MPGGALDQLRYRIPGVTCSGGVVTAFTGYALVYFYDFGFMKGADFGEGRTGCRGGRSTPPRQTGVRREGPHPPAPEDPHHPTR